MNQKTFDLIKTIDDDEEIEDFSEDSDIEEEEFQPKQKSKNLKDFDDNFVFSYSTFTDSETTKWNNTQKYVKRKAKSLVDEKIQRVRSELKKKIENKTDQDNAAINLEPDDITKENVSEDSDISLSGDELKPDAIKVKQTSIKRIIKEPGDENFFDDAPSFDESVSFYQMNLSRPLMKAISAMGYVHPTPIQAATIPVALLGKDICGCAATGTGKTAAYMLPALERLLYRPAREVTITRMIVLVPTRELGVQVYEVARCLAQFTTVEIGLSIGGLDVKIQENVLRKSPDIVIATPGRLIDHMKNTPSFSLDSIELLVLDEADRMLDSYFSSQMKEIVRQCSRTRQTLLFSATMTEEVEDLISVSLNKPVKIFVDNNKDVASKLRQEFVRIRSNEEGDRETILAALVCRTFRDHVMVFVPTKKQVHRIHILLGLLGIKVGELHGNLTQPQRLESLRRFKDEEIDVLVATDVASRGLDIVGVKTVINFTMPPTREHYIHRVGRTARAGRSGISVSLTGENEYKIVKELIKNAVLPPKSRVIPKDILTKYRARLEALESEIENILQQESEEKLLLKAESQANLAEKLVRGEKEQIRKREWFQTDKERLHERKMQKLAMSTSMEEAEHNEDQDSNLKKKGKVDNSKRDRIRDDLQKVQARSIKKKIRPKRLYSGGFVSTPGHVEDVKRINAKPKVPNKRKRREKSSFATDLADVSHKGVKRLRHIANAELNKLGAQRRKTEKNSIGEKMQSNIFL